MWWLIHYVLYVTGFLFAIFLVSQLLTQRRAPGSTAAWLLLMILIPHLGVPLFLLFGYRKIRFIQIEKQKLSTPVPLGKAPLDTTPLERMLLAAGVPPSRSGNQMELFDTPEGAYDVLMDALKNAKKSISITTFILKLDDVGKSICARLEERARAGVEVRLLLDGFGSFTTFGFRLKKFKQAGGKLSFFLPMIHIPFFGHSNLRNHRKLAIVDGKTAIIGGMNIAREYMGLGSSGHWVDLAFKIEGPVVADLEDVFRADWKFAAKELLPSSGQNNEPSNGNEVLRVVASGPDVSADPLYDSLVLAIFNAKKRVWIATPYFIPDEVLSKALELAAKRGVDVKLVVPGTSNHRLADFCRRSYVKRLIDSGGAAFYYPKMLHAKAMIVDDHFALVGSANLDMRSLLLNFELGLFVYSEAAIEDLSMWFDRRIAESQLGKVRDSYVLDMLDGVGRILGPIL